MQLVVDLFDFSIECSKFISVFVQFWSGQGRKFLESLSLGQKGCCQDMFIFSFSHIDYYLLFLIFQVLSYGKFSENIIA